MQERDIFLAAIELAPEQRSKYLDTACQGDSLLRQRVDSLLAASESQADPLDSPATEQLGDEVFNAIRSELADTLHLDATLNFSEATGGPVDEAMQQPPGYEILAELGKGGMGVVYKARHLQLNRLVALKKIHAHCTEADERLRFLQEAEAIASIVHPNIVQVFEVGQHNESPFICLELAEQGSLADRLESQSLSPSETAVLVEKVARGMNAAHQAGIVHRDLKPSNILISRDGEPKITDFGLAKRLEYESGLTMTGAIMGTPAYMAPEQARGEGKLVGPAADVYAIGAVMYSCLTGQPPFTADSAVELLSQVVGEEPTPPQKLNSSIPADLQTICLKCMEKEIGRRYASADAVANELRRWIAREPIHARPASLIERTAKWVRRKPVSAALVFVCLLSSVLLLGGGFHFTTRLREQRDAAVRLQMQAEVNAQAAQEEKRIAVEKEREAREAQQNAEKIARMMVGFFEGSDFIGFSGRSVTSVADGQGSVKAIIDRVKPLLLDDDTFAGNPSFRAELLESAGSAYLSLTDPEQALELLEKASELQSSSPADDLLQQASLLEKIGVARWQLGDLEESPKLVQQALEIRRRLAGERDPATMATTFYLAMIHMDRNEMDQSKQLLKPVLEFRRRQLGSALAGSPDQVGSAAERLLHVLIVLVQQERDTLTSLRYIAEIQSLLPHYPDERFLECGTHFIQAGFYKRMDQFDAAREQIIGAAEIAEELFGKQHIFCQIILREYGSIQFWSKHYPESEALYKELLARGGPNTRRFLAEAQEKVGESILEGRAKQALRAGDQEEYQRAMAEGEDWLRKASETELQNTEYGTKPASATHKMGAHLLNKDPPEYELAAEYLREALRRRWERLGYSAAHSASSVLLLWMAEIGLGHADKVNELVQELKEEASEPIEWDSIWRFDTRLMKVARFLAAGGHDESAIFVLEQALIAGFKGVDRLPTIAEFRHLAEQEAFQDLIERYSKGQK